VTEANALINGGCRSCCAHVRLGVLLERTFATLHAHTDMTPS